MTTVEKSLRCLRHPITLCSLGLLLLNDYVLKAATPGWLTGKLSDVAGLFFFPFVLAAFLGLLLARWHPSPRRVGGLAFGLTAAWFALMKLTPWGNALTDRLVTMLLRAPASIALDPTDLLALPVLWPAWKLWEREKAEPSRLLRLDWALLGLASLASFATSGIEYPTINRVINVDGIVYVRADPQSGYHPVIHDTLARSDDGGLTWTVVQSAPAELQQDVTLPLVACDPANPSLCFRITGRERVEESQDGGQTWHIAWQLPAGRGLYRQRLLVTYPCDQYGFSPEARDLTVLRKQDGLYVVSAMGSEGLLVREPSGRWTRVAVLGAYPVPLSGNLMGIWRELLSVFAFGVIAAFGLLGFASHVIFERVNRLPGWAIGPSKIAGALILLLVGFTLLVGETQIAPATWFFCSLLALLGYGLTWRRIGDFVLHRGAGLALNLYNLLAVVLVWLVAGTPFVLWANGVIALYGIALALALLAMGAVLTWSVWLVQRVALLAATPPGA